MRPSSENVVLMITPSVAAELIEKLLLGEVATLDGQLIQWFENRNGQRQLKTRLVHVKCTVPTGVFGEVAARNQRLKNSQEKES